MTKTAKNSLMNLPKETKELVNQGVFSLYSLSSEVAKKVGAFYVLYTSQHSFLLSEAGDVVKEFDSKERFKVEKAINFPDLITTAIRFGNFNIA